MIDALNSRHEDVRIGAAASLAEAGRGEAVPTLLDQIRSERPKVAELAKAWSGHVRTALTGLGWLRRPEAMEPVAALAPS